MQLLGADGGHVDADLVPFAAVDLKGKAGAVFLVDAVAALLPAGLFQRLLGLFGVIGKLFHIRVVIRPHLQRGIGYFALAEQHAVDDGLAVDGIAERIGQLGVVFEQVVVKVIQNAPVVGGFHIVGGKALQACKLLGVLRGHLCQVHLAAFEL